jgi:dCTP deaminase
MPRSSGILPLQAIQSLSQEGHILHARSFEADQVQPASLDVRLGRRCWRIRASFLSGLHRKVEERLQDLALHEIDLTNGAVLETGCVYLVELQESLALPPGICASANPKSSTGRLDVFTRLILDHSRAFDRIDAGYKGKIYLEICPQTFPVLVREGSRLAQVRFRQGEPLLSPLETEELQNVARLVDTNQPDFSQGIAVSIDLDRPEGQPVGYRARRHTGVIDVDKKGLLAREEFWEPVFTYGKKELILDPDEFYILVSKEAVHVPPLFAAEMLPFDALVGEFRAHYAGFFDPGFGHGVGARAVLEVRSREVPFILEDGQIVARLIYEHMLEKPSHLYGEGSNYQGQGLKLSKHFKAI